MKALFRIDQVLRGDAPTVALLGTDGDGREVRLEVPSAAVGALRPGGVLVLDWWVGSLPIDATATVRPQRRRSTGGKRRLWRAGSNLPARRW
jgi:hypothetical protein